MTSSTLPPVLVVGAGPAGLVAALALLINGVPVRVIEKDTKFHEGTRGPGIQPRTFEVMQSIGILSDVQRVARPLPQMRSYKFPGGTEPDRTWNLVEKLEPTPSSPFEAGYYLGQNRLEEILRSHLKQHGVAVELGKELIGFEQDEEGVTAQLRCHSEGGEAQEAVRASYLVGADGARGVVRKLLGLTFLGERRDADAIIVGDIKIANVSKDFWHFWDKEGITFMVLSVDPNSDTCAAVVAGRLSDPAALAQPVELKKFIHEHTERKELDLVSIEWLSHFRPNMRMVNKFSEGRVFVTGDAAHVHSPTGGQGMNSSVQDSYNLAWKLALVYRGLAAPSLLASYTEERLPVIAEMLRQTTGLYTATFGAGRGADLSGWSRTRTLFMLDINYRWSDIVREERAPAAEHADTETLKAHAYGGYEHGLCAGDRAPDAPGLVPAAGSVTSLFGIFDAARHTVLVFPTGSAPDGARAVLRAARTLPAGTVQTAVVCRPPVAGAEEFADADFVIADRDGHAHGGYLIEDGMLTVVIVRPDGYIGAIVRAADGVERYFANIFSTE